MLRSRPLAAIAACALLALVLPSGAGAATLNLNGFPATFPKASALCAKAAKGKLGKKLRPSRAKVLKACDGLRASYSAAYTTLSNAVAPLRAQSRDAVEASRTACREAKRARNLAACRQAQIEARNKLAAIRNQTAPLYATARKAYEAARKTFWTTIKKLKGGSSIAPDAAVAEPTQDVVPDDKAVDEPSPVPTTALADVTAA